jgi:chromosome segregation ATPase
VLRILRVAEFAFELTSLTLRFIRLKDFKSLGEKQVLQRLKEVNESLKKFAGVNRKALDQYVSFNEQRENLVGRREELIRDTEAIEQLVQTLDSQKVCDRRCNRADCDAFLAQIVLTFTDWNISPDCS